ncbi:hypothetical protein [Kitasatospora paranensis]|uniref:hypothetical protein n=1 Tax=Kitasatospora paranensis TaxID=258053 RepID=UPI0031E80D82
MSARARRHAAAALVSALTVGSTLLLSACDPQAATGVAAGNAAPATAAKPSDAASSAAPALSGATASATPSAPPSPTAPVTASAAGRTTAPARNGAVQGLTISNGTNLVLMNGTSVDFHTAVRDLAWSPDGGRAAFIDGAGDLSVSRADGSHRVVVARNPGGRPGPTPPGRSTLPTPSASRRRTTSSSPSDRAPAPGWSVCPRPPSGPRRSPCR